MIAPKKTKFRTAYVRSLKGVALKGSQLEYGDFGLVSKEACFVTPNQIESARRVISGVTKRSGKVWIRVFPDQPMTKKPANVRMGSGKGGLDKFVATVKPGRILFELGGLDNDLAVKALKAAAQKLPVLTTIISK